MLLLIAYGNSLRQDDGAGLQLAARLAEIWRAEGVPLRLLQLHQLMPELTLELAAEEVEQVVFVDTQAVPPVKPPPVLIKPLTAQVASPVVGHYFDPLLLLLYAERLYNKRPPAWLITIPGVQFNHGESLSSITQALLENALQTPSIINLPHIKL